MAIPTRIFLVLLRLDKLQAPSQLRKLELNFFCFQGNKRFDNGAQILKKYNKQRIIMGKRSSIDLGRVIQTLQDAVYEEY